MSHHQLHRRMMPGSFSQSVMGGRLAGSVPAPMHVPSRREMGADARPRIIQPAADSRRKDEAKDDEKVVHFAGMDSMGPHGGGKYGWGGKDKVKKKEKDAIRKTLKPGKEPEEELPLVGALIKTSQPFRQVHLGSVLEVRDTYRPLLVKWQDGRLDAAHWTDNEQLQLYRRALRAGDKVIVTKKALEDSGWKDQRTRRPLKHPDEDKLPDKFRAEVIQQVIVLNNKVVPEGTVVEALTRQRDHDGEKGCTCKMASEENDWKEEIDPKCPIVGKRDVKLMVQARVDVGGGEVHIADLEPWDVTLVSSMYRSMFQMAAKKAVQDQKSGKVAISASTHAQVQARGLLRFVGMLKMARAGDAGLLESELAAGGVDVNMTSAAGATLLGEACRSSNADAGVCCVLLAEYGADVNMPEGPRCLLPMDEELEGGGGRPEHDRVPLLSRLHMRARPLHVACARGNFEAVKALVQCGADLTLLDVPLESTRPLEDIPSAVFLRQGLKHTPFLSACCGGSTRCVEAIIRASSAPLVSRPPSDPFLHHEAPSRDGTFGFGGSRPSSRGWQGSGGGADSGRLDAHTEWARGTGRSYGDWEGHGGSKRDSFRESTATRRIMEGELDRKGQRTWDSQVTGDSWEWVLDDKGERRGGAWLRAWGERNAVDSYVINARDGLGRSGLHWACYSGSDEIAQMLLLAGASACMVDGGGYTPVHMACMGGEVSCIKTVAEEAARQDGCKLRDVLGWQNAATAESALHCAAQSSDAKAVEYVVRNGGHVTDRDGSGRTALMAAPVEHDNPDVLTELLIAGADPNAKDDSHSSLLHYCISYQRPNMLSLLLEPFFRPAKPIAERFAGGRRGERREDNPLAWMGEDQTPKLVGGGRLDLNQQDKDGATPLIQAIKMRDDVSAAALVQAGALVSPKDRSGKTALEHAVRNQASHTLMLALKGKGGAAAPFAKAVTHTPGGGWHVSPPKPKRAWEQHDGAWVLGEGGEGYKAPERRNNAGDPRDGGWMESRADVQAFGRSYRQPSPRDGWQGGKHRLW